jgi:MFS family permease
VTAPASPFSFPQFRFYWSARLASTIASTLLVVVLGVHVYDVARETMSIARASFWLGMVGLAQFLPLFALTLVAGYVADRVDRRWIVRSALALELGCAVTLALLAANDAVTLPWLFAVAVALGVGRAFAGPALAAFAPNLVPPASLPSAIALGSIAWQSGAVTGPLIGGFSYDASPTLAYGISAALLGLSLLAMFQIRPLPLGDAGKSNPLRAVIDGIAYVRRNRIVLGAISLDLFAVLLGGATAMLPVYARDILFVGSEGLGLLRAAPSIGAAATALLLVRYPLRRQGRRDDVLVRGAVRAGDARVRRVEDHVAVGRQPRGARRGGHGQRLCPLLLDPAAHAGRDARPRVGGSGLFISASNELGEFRAGIAGSLVGPVAAVVGGGALAIAVTGLCAWAFPALRRADRFAVPDDLTQEAGGAKGSLPVEAPALAAGADPQTGKAVR